MLGTVMLHSFTFILGFSFVFIVLGAVATGLGQFFNQYHHVLARIAGIIIIIFGLHLTGLLKIKALYADKRLHDVKGSSSALGSFVVGFAFAFGWTPCIGPILAAILALASEQDKVAKGVLLLAIYSLGLAVPFLLTSLGIDRFLSFYGKFQAAPAHGRIGKRRFVDCGWRTDLHEQSEAALWLSGFSEPVCSIKASL